MHAGFVKAVEESDSCLQGQTHSVKNFSGNSVRVENGIWDLSMKQLKPKLYSFLITILDGSD
jgi:hypothetical protein